MKMKMKKKTGMRMKARIDDKDFNLKNSLRYGLILAVITLSTLVMGSLDCDVRGVTAVPGEVLNFDMRVSNDLNLDRSTRLYYEVPEGFDAKFVYQEKEVEWLQLNSYQSKSIEFQVEVPDDAEEREYFIRAYASGMSGKTFRINVEERDRLKITPSISGVSIEAGEKVNFPLTIKNELNAEYGVDLSCLTPENWSYRFMDNGMVVYRIVLKPYEQRTLTLEVESDSSAEVKEHEISSYFNQQATELNVRITETHKGEQGKIKLKVVGKDGRAVDSARIEVADSEFFTSAEGEATIEVPQGAYEPEISKGGYYTEELEEIEVKAGMTVDMGTIMVEKKPYFVEVSVSTPSVSFVLGSGNPTFKFRVENKGYADDTYSFGVDGLPEDFHSRFKEAQQSTESTSEVFVPSGESKDVYLEILTPPNARIGDYNLTLTVDGHQTVEKGLKLSLRGEYRVHFEPMGGRYLTTAEAGDVAEFEASLRNIGRGATLTDLNISLSGPSGWETSVSPSDVPAVQSGDRIPLKITAFIPPDALPSEYKLQLNIQGDQINDREELKVIIKEKSYAGIMGGAIILAALAGLFIVFRKFGRR